MLNSEAYVVQLIAENRQGPIGYVFPCLKLTQIELIFKGEGENKDHQAIRKQTSKTSISFWIKLNSEEDWNYNAWSPCFNIIQQTTSEAKSGKM